MTGRLRAFLMRLGGSFSKRRRDREFAQELESLVALHTEENVRAGMTPEDARREALLRIGGLEPLKEAYRDRLGWPFLDGVKQDFRYAFRALKNSPGFAGVAILCLALGIGANTAIFTLLDELLLKWLPVKNPEELVILGDPNPGVGAYSYCYQTYTQLRDHNTVFSGLLARNWWEFYFSADGETQPLNVELVSGNYFEVLGVNAYLGRVLRPDDDRVPGAGAVAVLSYEFWSSRFGRDRGVIGKTVRIQGHPFTIIGVSPPGFSGVGAGISQEIRVPWSMAGVLQPGNWNPFDVAGKNLQHSDSLHVMGRLRPGVSAEQAQASLAPLFASIRREHADTLNWGDGDNARAADRQRFLDRAATLRLVGSGFAGLKVRFTRPLQALMALVGVLLLIACSTLANLLLARSRARQREIAVRLALGAGRARIIRQSLLESVVLAVAGAAVGVLIAWWGAGALVTAFWGSASPMFDPTRLSLKAAPDQGILAFTAGLSLLTALLFGLAPALHAAQVPVIAALKAKGAAVAGWRSHMTIRKSLIVVQMALCLLLINAAGLFVRTLESLDNLDSGMDTRHLIQIPINPDPYSQLTDEQKQQYYRQIVERIENIPGVRSAARSKATLMTSRAPLWRTTVEESNAATGQSVRLTSNAVSSRYFETAGLPLLAGRIWTPQDDYRRTVEAVISQSFAAHFFNGRSPLNATLTAWNNRKYQIVGVVGDSRYGDLRDDDPRAVYYPAGEFGAENLLVAASGDPAKLKGAVEREARSVSGTAYVHPVRTMDEQMNELLAEQRLVAWLAGLFGALAALLAAAGLYGVVAYLVAWRTQEIGLRVALGASRADILWLVLREVLTLVASGAAVGLMGAYALLRLVASLLFGVSATDPFTMAGSALLMCAIAALAAYVPAWRATRIAPMVALRCE